MPRLIRMHHLLKNGHSAMVNRVIRNAGLLVCILLLAFTGCSQELGQKKYTTPEEAALALHTAVKANDSSAMMAILGASSGEVINSGDKVQDENARRQFTTRFEQMNRIGREVDGSRVLYIGAENWPFPIPLRQADGQWYFDTVAGKQEILFRRIGRNEYTAMRVLRALEEAQEEYYATTQQYAQKVLSSEGQHDGLYWKTVEGEPESPIGPLIAYAAAAGYGKSANTEPFYGYFFKLLKEQGPAAKGGAENYVKDGKMTRGFAFVAYPAEHGVSGVMTFLINREGVVYQKDLGDETADLGRELKMFNPDETWELAPVDEAQADTD